MLPEEKKWPQASNGDMPISRPVPCLPGVFKYGNPQSRIHLTEKPLQLMRDIVKITEPGKAFMPDGKLELPYEGGKPMLRVERLEDRDFLKKLVRMTCEALPEPKKKR